MNYYIAYLFPYIIYIIQNVRRVVSLHMHIILKIKKHMNAGRKQQDYRSTHIHLQTDIHGMEQTIVI
jgi:hypothetical protein